MSHSVKSVYAVVPPVTLCAAVILVGSASKHIGQDAGIAEAIVVP